MPSLAIFFRVHQPYRFRKFAATEVDVQDNYRDEWAERKCMDRIADLSYLPTNALLLSLINKNEGRFRVSFSISGCTLELMASYRPDVLDSFRKLVDTGCVEIMAETYYHSLSYLYCTEEFERQVFQHINKVDELFGTKPAVFRNTELIYDDHLAMLVADMGLKGLLCEGVQRILQGRSPNKVYAAPGNSDFPLFLRNVELSDDIAFRFGHSNWNQHPLTSGKFAEWIHAHPGETQTIQLLLDYETFGIHKSMDSGIFNFLEELPQEVLVHPQWSFHTPSEIIHLHYPTDIYQVSQTISWDDKSRDNCVICENARQNNTLKKVYSLGAKVWATRNEDMIHKWGILQMADHFYYWNQESSITGCKYPNPFQSVNDAFSNYFNILTDFEIRLIRCELDKNRFSHYQQPLNLF